MSKSALAIYPGVMKDNDNYILTCNASSPHYYGSVTKFYSTAIIDGLYELYVK